MVSVQIAYGRKVIPKELLRAGLKGGGGGVDRTGRVNHLEHQQSGDSGSHLLSY